MNAPAESNSKDKLPPDFVLIILCGVIGWYALEFKDEEVEAKGVQYVLIGVASFVWVMLSLKLPAFPTIVLGVALLGITGAGGAILETCSERWSNYLVHVAGASLGVGTAIITLGAKLLLKRMGYGPSEPDDGDHPAP